MARKKPKKIKKAEEIGEIDRRLATIEAEEEKIDIAEQKLKDLVKKEEKEIAKIEEEEKKIEKVLLNIGKFTIKRTHLLELARSVAGAFLGVGVGMGLRWVPDVAEPLSWLNVLGILGFVLFVSGVLIYKQEKEKVKKSGMLFVVKKMLFIYSLCIAVEFIALALFNVIPTNPVNIVKTLIVGSYTAMAGAITFTLI
jgi:uncharacterized membrane protein